MACLPAYGVDAATLVDAPQCSQSGEFCFLCAFEADANGNDLYGSVVDLVEHLVAQKREIASIVRQVSQVYDTTVRDSVVYNHPDTDEEIRQPHWSHSSIRRHLLFSTQFSGLFDQVVQHILHSLVVKHNATM